MLGFKDGDGFKDENLKLTFVLVGEKSEMWKNVVPVKPFQSCVFPLICCF